MNYFEHHIGDWDQATAHLSAVEDGIYSRLVRWYMASEGPLPLDIAVVQRRVRARARDEKAAVQAVLEEFFDRQEDGYHQHRCDEEIARYQDKQRKAKASADARWSKDKAHSERNANAFETHDADGMRTHSEGNALHTPDTNPQTPRNPSGSRASSKSPRKPAGSKRVPADFAVDADMEAWATESAPLIDWRRETEKFRDWEFKTPRTDWAATWRTWMRKAQEGAVERGHGVNSSMFAGAI